MPLDLEPIAVALDGLSAVQRRAVVTGMLGQVQMVRGILAPPTDAREPKQIGRDAVALAEETRRTHEEWSELDRAT